MPAITLDVEDLNKKIGEEADKEKKPGESEPRARQERGRTRAGKRRNHHLPASAEGQRAGNCH